MAYDKLSFLSGVAAGRNMESWPAFEGADAPSLFAYEIIMASSGTYSGWRVGFPDGGVIIWGDGNKSTYPKGASEHITTHSYDAPGTYLIIILGAASDGMLHEEGIRYEDPPLKRILTPFPSTVTVSPLRLFNYQSNLEYICQELFSECIISGSDALGFCNRCSKLQTIFPQWFERMNLTRLESAFAHIGTELFAPVVIPKGLLNSCTALINIDSLFEGANVAGDLSGLFDYCVSLERADYAFSETKIQAIPQDLFDNNPGITRFVRTFYGCTEVVGDVPELWITHPSASHSRCFGEMTPAQIPNYALIPSGWK